MCRDQPEDGKIARFRPEFPVGRAPPDGGAHLGGAALEYRRGFSLHRYWRGDLQHLVAVVGRAVHKTHEQRRAGHLGEGHCPGQQSGPVAEEGNLHGAGPVAVQRRRVDRDRHHLIGAEYGCCQRRDLGPARPWLDVRPLPVAPQRPEVKVPEPPLGG